jgi:single-stranded-DNA-specific exonuclease
MRPKRWVFARTDRAAGARLARALNISPLTATLLVNRGLSDPDEARRFLSPELSGLLDPLRFEDMGRAVDRLEAALRGGEKVGIFGDYDVDGASGTAILVKLFGLLEHPVTYRVPHRVRDGYGLNAAAVEAFAREGVRVLLTVDCGTRDLEELGLARSLGIDVIVLDHHEPGPELPPALALINPKRPGSPYGFTGICSSGIAFKLAWALGDRAAVRRRPGFDGFILDAMGLAALGTVADVCPLTGENRVFVRYGLDALRACRGRGLRALLGRAGLEGRALDTFDVSFKLAPRLNALGRLGSAMDCVELLVTDDAARVEAVLEVLERSNRDRKGIEDEIFEQACAQAEAAGGAGQPAVVVADERWHVGVVGIVAARLVDRYHRPAFVLAVDNGVARGSARSVEGWPLHEALAACGDLLLTHGGHAMAAGLSLRTENLEAFRRRILRRAERDLTPERLEPRLDVDDEVPLGAVTRPVVREIARLAPHGPGNPPPLLAAAHVRVAGEPRLMGRRNEHLSLYLAQDGVSVRAVGFGMATLWDSLRRARTVSVAFTPEINSWQGTESVELRLRDVKPEGE